MHTFIHMYHAYGELVCVGTLGVGCIVCCFLLVGVEDYRAATQELLPKLQT